MPQPRPWQRTITGSGPSGAHGRPLATCRTRSSRSADDRTPVARTWWRPVGGPVRRCAVASPVAVSGVRAAVDGVRRPTTSSMPPSGPEQQTAALAVIRPCRRRSGLPMTVHPGRHPYDNSPSRSQPQWTAAKCHCLGRVPTSCPSTSRSKSPITVVRRFVDDSLCA